ncbi:hypothetical protein VN97_g9462 [Penicillium thymicola]|uniref:Uncharacterized protein n=1 Tax=Penicillium thymicola TaxID=293382 RepID=A0AAI9X4U6_PENTH|nr:hypothetical protein VN97_g9462 [Penicillium thymicola]
MKEIMSKNLGKELENEKERIELRKTVIWGVIDEKVGGQRVHGLIRESPKVRALKVPPYISNAINYNLISQQPSVI